MVGSSHDSFREAKNKARHQIDVCNHSKARLTQGCKEILTTPQYLHTSFIKLYHNAIMMIHARRRGMRYRRSRIDIFSQILEAAHGADTKKTKIMYKASLSDQALNEYLAILTDSDLLRYRLDMHTFKTTEKGLRFLETYNKMDLAMKTQQ